MKQMPDREKVIKGLNDIGDFIAGRIGFEQARNFLRTLDDVLAILTEQDAIKPITEHRLFLCPVCKNTLFREQKFCHECGKRIEWEGG